MRKILFLFLIISCLNTLYFAQGSSGTNAKYEYRNLVDLQTAGVIGKGYVGVNMDVMPYGAVITKIEVGVMENFSFGISYGGSNVIGSGNISWYKLPGVNVRARILDETESFPAVTMGFDSQGKGRFDKNLNRYQIKSPGFFVAGSKNYEFFGYLSLHAVINYSLERDDSDKDLDLGIGFEKTIGQRISLVGEYDFAINDNTGEALGNGNGYMNFGVRWSVGDGLTLGLNLRDLLDNKKINGGRADRGIFIDYVKALF